MLCTKKKEISRGHFLTVMHCHAVHIYMYVQEVSAYCLLISYKFILT